MNLEKREHVVRLRIQLPQREVSVEILIQAPVASRYISKKMQLLTPVLELGVGDVVGLVLVQQAPPRQHLPPGEPLVDGAQEGGQGLGVGLRGHPHRRPPPFQELQVFQVQASRPLPVQHAEELLRGARILRVAQDLQSLQKLLQPHGHRGQRVQVIGAIKHARHVPLPPAPALPGMLHQRLVPRGTPGHQRGPAGHPGADYGAGL
mmetsp:Transcript_11139/g.28250  ORF Transcript_11139/g.28250 Transcript_11139/m.28250 type:complete len:206 (-) Transcript_11139:1046-1663(-)